VWGFFGQSKVDFAATAVNVVVVIVVVMELCLR
jgi:hypothetical protein